MKEIKEIILKLIQGISPKQAFILLLFMIILAGSYFIIDRIFDHIERNDEFTKLKGRVINLEQWIQNKVLTTIDQ